MATEAEAGVAQPLGWPSHQELDEAGGTLPWSPQRERRLTPELTLLAPGRAEDQVCLFEAPGLALCSSHWDAGPSPPVLGVSGLGERTTVSGGPQPSFQWLSASGL